jgi:hypothetical protein
MSKPRKEEEARRLEILLLEGLKSGKDSSVNRECWREVKIQAASILRSK